MKFWDPAALALPWDAAALAFLAAMIPATARRIDRSDEGAADGIAFPLAGQCGYSGLLPVSILISCSVWRRKYQHGLSPRWGKMALTHC